MQQLLAVFFLLFVLIMAARFKIIRKEEDLTLFLICISLFCYFVFYNFYTEDFLNVERQKQMTNAIMLQDLLKRCLKQHTPDECYRRFCSLKKNKKVTGPEGESICNTFRKYFFTLIK
uniref:Uncharacterized protein n=1 Tax=Trachydiscus minutus TaxID=1032745 RepID=A0A140F2Q2_9STRA|nr:hypothetical protein [Trachydiscus minutus]AML60686.1 hypothetical protein [Trachydiscus minutus]